MTSSKKNTKQHEIKGVELHVQGIVQGVGFRPFIYNLAVQHNISGTVSNTSAGVFIQAAAEDDALQRFISAIRSSAPPLARIHSLEKRSLPADEIVAEDGFRILASDGNAASSTAIPPDIALCEDCLRELLSPADRRYRYPFINCTNCGPRFTIVETIPYDRPKTSMKVFPMCSDCEREYQDPANRRFHAQPNACPSCGPQLSLHDASGVRIDAADIISAAVSALRDDKVVAIRGLGGFHLSVNGCSEAAVERLRQRKNRPTKPLAIMVKDLDAARSLCRLSPEEEQELVSPEHPIVLLPVKDSSCLAANLNPGVGDIGIMLPYTPLHHLLFHDKDCPAALVMTSGNISGHPICISNETAIAQLGSIADLFVLHNREILTRVDDSVIKKIHSHFRIFRRARGFSPSPLPVPHELPEVIGVGAGLKSTFCLGRQNLTFLSQHIGDLYSLETHDFYVESINHHKKVFDIEPVIAVRDLHPDYMSSHYAESLGLVVYSVQHHHAHAVAVMAEHGLDENVIAVVLDGTGFGSDHTIWGGEILLASLTDYERLAHLEQLLLPGGDKAAVEPWRMGMAALFQAYGPEACATANLPAFLRQVAPEKRKPLLTMMENRFNSPLTSSCGRLFDAVAALVDLRLTCDYEGHAAMELEALAMRSWTPEWKTKLESATKMSYLPFLCKKGGKWEIISSEFVKMVIDKKSAGVDVSQIAFDFHIDLICAISKLTTQLSVQHNTNKVVLSGGCMQNRLLMEGLFFTLEGSGLQVFTGEKVPVNDGGISFGQTISGGLQHVSRDSNESNERFR